MVGVRSHRGCVRQNVPGQSWVENPPMVPRGEGFYGTEVKQLRQHTAGTVFGRPEPKTTTSFGHDTLKWFCPHQRSYESRVEPKLLVRSQGVGGVLLQGEEAAGLSCPALRWGPGRGLSTQSGSELVF